MDTFKIGDSVFDTKTNKSGVITDILYSHANEENVYYIKPDDGGRSFTRSEDEITLIAQNAKYYASTEILNNVVVAIIYESKDGKETEVCRGHGHIIHEGAQGIAQACAYAYKRAFEKVDTGIYKKQYKAAFVNQ